jgi:hypothetical protein
MIESSMKTAKQVRSELLVALSELSGLRPEWRLGQTLANIAMTAGRLEAGSVCDLDDEEALEAAKTLIEQYSKTESLAIQSNAARQQ